MASRPRIVPIAIGSYVDPGYPELAADAEVEQVVALVRILLAGTPASTDPMEIHP